MLHQKLVILLLHFLPLALSYIFQASDQQRQLCHDIVEMSKKVKTLSAKIAKLDFGPIYTLSSEDEDFLTIQCNYKQFTSMEQITTLADKQSNFIHDLDYRMDNIKFIVDQRKAQTEVDMTHHNANLQKKSKKLQKKNKTLIKDLKKVIKSVHQMHRKMLRIYNRALT